MNLAVRETPEEKQFLIKMYQYVMRYRRINIITIHHTQFTLESRENRDTTLYGAGRQVGIFNVTRRRGERVY